MDKEEIGQMESRLFDIELRISDMDDDQIEKTIADLARYILVMNERIKTLEYNASYVSDSIRINI